MSWIKIGCISVIALPLILLAVVGGLVMLQPQSGESAERVLEHEVPPGGAPLLDADTSRPGYAEAAIAAPGKVTINLSGVELFLKAASAGTPIRVSAVYEESAGELVDTFEPGSGEGWSYTLRFSGPEASLIRTLSRLFGGNRPQFTVFLPVGTPMALELRLAQGGGLVDLGGLALTTVDLELTQGGLEMDVSRPLAQPLERFTSIGNMGGLGISFLGNASPRVIDVKQRMGGVEVDLRGAWMQDSEIAVSVDMAGGVIRVPDNVAIRGLAGRGIDDVDTGEAGSPTLTISTRANMGEVEVLR